MNEQNNLNNQFNNQFNNQPSPEGLEMPREHIKKKFFSTAFLADDSVDSTATGAFVPSENSVVTNTAFATDNTPLANPSFNDENNFVPSPNVPEESNIAVTPSIVEENIKENIETLDDDNDIEELDVLDDEPKQEEIEELDVLDEEKVVEGIEAPHPEISYDQTPQPTAMPDGYIPSYNRQYTNQGPQVGVIKPHGYDQNVDPNFGYNTQVVQPGMQNAIPAAGIAGAAMMAQQAPSIESSAIFQAANQQPTASNVTPANQVVDNTPVQQWMTNQPLSSANIESTTIEENKVMSANQREELERRKNEPVVPVPTEVTKPSPTVNVRPELLVKEYIGDDYTSLTMAPLNFGALFLGAAYFAYRKLYIWSLINMVIVGCLLFFVPTNYNYLAVLGFHLLMALAVNRIYIFNTKLMAKGVARRNAKKKKPKTQEELEENMRIRGRVSFVNALLAVCLFVAGVISISMFVLPNNDVSKLINKAFGGGNPFKVKEFKYTGTIVYDEQYDVTNLLDIWIPDAMIDTEGLKSEPIVYYKYIGPDPGEYNICSIKIGTIKDFDNGNSYVVKVAAYNGEDDKIKKGTTNGIEWTNYYTKDDNYEIYYKGATIKDKALLLEYRIGKDAPQEQCSQYYLQIMESIKLKEE